MPYRCDDMAAESRTNRIYERLWVANPEGDQHVNRARVRADAGNTVPDTGLSDQAVHSHAA